MPVKVRCRGCEKVLNAPDKARGRVIKCPKCGTKLKVPSGKSKTADNKAAAKPTASRKASSSQPERKQVKAAALPLSETDFFANLDFGQAEDTESRICPYCAADLEEENDVCPGCGMNVVLGEMDRKEAKRRRRKGPDPALFYKAAWRESWGFMRQHKDLAFRTGWYMTVFVVLCCTCFALYDFSSTGPPKFFWACCTFVCAMGLPGWFFFLSMKIVAFSMSTDKDEKFGRIHFDFFRCVTMGMRTIFWPAVMLIPFLPLIGFMVFLGVTRGNFAPTYILLGILSLFPLMVLPLAIPHMTAKYTYKAWIMWEMGKVLMNNLAPALYWVLMAGLTLILPFGLLFGAIQVFGGGMNPFFNEYYLGLTNQVMTQIFEAVDFYPTGMFFTAVVSIVRFVLAFAIAVPLFMLTGFPLVFLMRANGLLGYYRQRDLDLVQKMYADTPAGFWVRMLAFLVDMLMFPLASFIVTSEKRALFIGQALNGLLLASLPLIGLRFVILVMLPIWSCYNLWLYFAVQESNTQRTTIGKDAFGLIVSRFDNTQLSLRNSTLRLIAALLSPITAFLGFAMCAFHPEKKALHDMISKTKVVWKGDR